MVKHSLIIPCYNEEGNIKNFFKEACASMYDYTSDFQLVFINDGSTDSTNKVLNDIFAENPKINIKVIDFSRNFGKEAAIYAGISNADGEYITIIDADLQQHPKYAAEMGRILDDNPNCDIVAAYQKERKEKGFIAFVKTSFYKIINKISEINIIENSSDFRTFRKNVAETILNLPEYHRFSKGIFSWIGFNTIKIPYEVNDRLSGSSKWSFKKLFKYALDGIVSYTDLPLKLPLFFSILSFVISLILFIVAIILDVTTLKTVSNMYIGALILFVTGFLSCFQGIIGYYLGKVHTQVKNRPIYIIKNILSHNK